ncbi:methyltransferase domain-containing protein [Methylobacterium durans]|uniref:methyltransferase domain-containing protein n=1 Tax=Methylobacterium durans TaxID=2202825 RepID=UPI0013A541E6
MLVGVGEDLPFPSEYFDLVFSRVAMPHMLLPRAVPEIARVHRAGGELWCVLHPPWMLLDRVWDKLRRLDLKGLAYRLSIAPNSVLLCAFGRQMRGMGLCETVQTEGRIRRVMANAGLRSIPVERSRFMAVGAIKMCGPPVPPRDRGTSVDDDHRPGDPRNQAWLSSQASNISTSQSK